MSIEILLELDGVNFSAMILNGMDIERNKLWGDDSGRLMSGNWVGTLIGIFPKLVVSFLPKNENELSALIAKLDMEALPIRYYNPKTRSMASLGTYTSDYKITINTMLGFDIEPVQCSFIATRKE